MYIILKQVSWEDFLSLFTRASIEEHYSSYQNWYAYISNFFGKEIFINIENHFKIKEYYYHKYLFRSQQLGYLIPEDLCIWNTDAPINIF